MLETGDEGDRERLRKGLERLRKHRPGQPGPAPAPITAAGTAVRGRLLAADSKASPTWSPTGSRRPSRTMIARLAEELGSSDGEAGACAR